MRRVVNGQTRNVFPRLRQHADYPLLKSSSPPSFLFSFFTCHSSSCSSSAIRPAPAHPNRWGWEGGGVGGIAQWGRVQGHAVAWGHGSHVTLTRRAVAGVSNPPSSRCAFQSFLLFIAFTRVIFFIRIIIYQFTLPLVCSVHWACCSCCSQVNSVIILLSRMQFDDAMRNASQTQLN